MRIGKMPLPCFRPDSPEDSLFPPRCGHAAQAPFGFGDRQMGRLPNEDQSQRALGIGTGDRIVGVFCRTFSGSDDRR
jgi:hypothetical protein